MHNSFIELKKRISEIEEWLKKEFSTLRTGRATLAILDSIKVQSYGSQMHINQVASVSIEDPRTIRVAPWDKSLAKEIEKSVLESDLGLSVVSDDAGLRIIFPELTSERRESLIRLAGQKLEEARISLRKERDDTKNNIQKQKKDGLINEDDEVRLKQEMQKMIDEANKKLEEMTNNKEKEINS